MSIFRDTEELDQVMLILWERIRSNPDIAGKLMDSKLSVQFNYTDPPGTLILDCTNGNECTFSVRNTDIKPVIQMSMKADTAHEFWMGRLNVPMALLTGKIVSRGPTARALKLLPIITSGFSFYPEVLKQLGKEALLTR